MSYLYLCLLGVSFLLIEVLIGGTRVVFGLPAYAFLSLAALISILSFRRPLVPANIDCLIATILFFAYVLVRIILSPVEYLARSDLLMVLAALIVYLLIILHLTAPKYRWWMVALLMGIGLVHVLIGMVTYFTGRKLSLSFLQPADYGLRASGLYICPNNLAGFLEVSVLFGLSLVCWSRRSFMLKLLTTYASLAGLVGILLTGSRGGYLSLIFGLFTFAGLSLITIQKAKRRRFALATTLVGAGLVLTIAASVYFVRHQYPLHSRATKLMSGEQDVRLVLWKMALQQFALNPAIGTGSGTYHYYARQLRPPTVLQDPVYAHNDYLQFLAEFGVAGAVLFLIFLFTHLWTGWKSLMWFTGERGAALGRMQSDSLALNIGAISAVMTYILHSVVDFNLHVPANAMLIAFVFGILANPGVVLPLKEAHFPRISRYMGFALPALALWIAYAGLRTMPAEYNAERARVALRDERYPESIRYARQGLRWDDTNPYLYLYLGQGQAAYAQNAPHARAATNSWLAAVEAFRKGIRYFPQDQWLLMGLGETLDALKRFDEAEAVYRQALIWNPQWAPIRARYGTHLRLAGKLDEAESEYKRSMTLHWNHEAATGLEQLARERPPRGQ